MSTKAKFESTPAQTWGFFFTFKEEAKLKPFKNVFKIYAIYESLSIQLLSNRPMKQSEKSNQPK